MSSDIDEISQLASILHQNGDKVLKALSKFTLNAVLLQKLNNQFNLILENVNNTNNELSYAIVSENESTQILKDLQFLNDFIQKTVSLKLTNNSDLCLLSNKVDISNFKNIKYLEIKKVPINKIVGLKNIQSQLESVVCDRCLSHLDDLFSKCGGDNNCDVVWNTLREAVLSFNKIKMIDKSIALAPSLQVLDLSHNQITDVTAIECLPNLKYINLSYNCLDSIPTFHKSAKKKIELLAMKNNYVENLKGLKGLSHLNELDLSNNWIANWESFYMLLTTSTLKCLSLAGNPISCYRNYRLIVAEYLHINASFNDFYLDKIKLCKKEKACVGLKLCDGNLALNKSILEEKLGEKTLITDSYSKKSSIPIRKSGKTRLVDVPNLDDGTNEEKAIDNQLESLNSSTEHLITKKRIEHTRSAYGVDNWLVHGSSVVQDILGLPSVEVSTSTPCDDLCLNAALDSVKNTITTVAVIETQPETVIKDMEKNNQDSFFTCNDEDSTLNYFSAETSREKENAFDKEKENSTGYVNDGFSSTEDVQDPDEKETTENENIFTVLKEVKANGGTIVQDELLLAMTENELREKELTKRKIITKWCLSTLESCIKLKPNKLQLVFDTVKRDKKERIYSFKENEANVLYKLLVEILENRTLSDMNQIVYKCENCSSQFSAEIKSGKTDNNMCCPFCRSKFILQSDEVPLPLSNSEKKNPEKNNKNSDAKVSHNRSFSASGFFQSFRNPNEDKSSSELHSQSSAGSAVSLNEIGELSSIQNNNIKKSDSDIEVLSNPSQSSIEIIDGPTKLVSANASTQKQMSGNENDIDDSLVPNLSASEILQNNPPALLTESSSSGSVTDSICTTYENSNANNSNSNKVVKKDSQKSEIEKNEPILQGVLTKITKTLKQKKAMDFVKYSYSDFTNLDHRIKLLLYTHVFEDAHEEFSFGIRAVVNPFNTNNFFPSCIIVSNKKLYFLKITNSEHGDDARNFLEKIDFLCFNLNAVKYIYTLTWYQGFAIKIQSPNNNKKWKQYLILLMNSTRTRNFLKFLTSESHCLNKTRINNEILEKPYMSLQHSLLSSTCLDDINIQYFCLFNTCTVTNHLNSTDIKFGGVLTNSTDMILIGGSLNWLFVESNDLPVFENFQKVKNLRKVFKNQCKVIFQFCNGDEETDVWSLLMEGEECVQELLKFVKDSWENIFFVPLKISDI